MNKNYIIGFGALVLLVVGVVFGYKVHSPQVITEQVGGFTSGQGTPTVFDNLSTTGGIRNGVPQSESGGPQIPASAGYGKGLATLVTSGTLVATQSVVIANPFAATSTITFANVQGPSSTSTIDLLVGTSTVSAGGSITNNSQVNATLINATSIASSSQIFTTAGAQSGPGKGYTNPGTASSASIVVGPSETIAILATSSNAIFNAANTAITNTGSTFSLTYTIEWNK